MVCKTDCFGQIHLLDVFLVSCHSLKQMFHTLGGGSKTNLTLFPVLPQNHVFLPCVSAIWPHIWLHTFCVVFCFHLNKSLATIHPLGRVSEVLWNVTVTPWVHSEVWCLVLDCSVTLLAFKEWIFVVSGCVFLSLQTHLQLKSYNSSLFSSVGGLTDY